MRDVTLLNEGFRKEQPENWQRFLEELAAGHDCALIEIAYLRQWKRDELVREVRKLYPDTNFEWIYFENDLEAANWNCVNDPDRTPEKIAGDLRNNERWTKQYKIPEGTSVRKIFRISKLDR